MARHSTLAESGVDSQEYGRWWLLSKIDSHSGVIQVSNHHSAGQLLGHYYGPRGSVNVIYNGAEYLAINPDCEDAVDLAAVLYRSMSTGALDDTDVADRVFEICERRWQAMPLSVRVDACARLDVAMSNALVSFSSIDLEIREFLEEGIH